jgi:hypothetical protein
VIASISLSDADISLNGADIWYWRRIFRDRRATAAETSLRRGVVRCPRRLISDIALRGAESSLGDAKSSLGDAESSLGDAKSSLGDTKSSLSDAYISLSDADISLSDADISLSDAYISLSGADISLSDADISLSDAYISLRDALITLGAILPVGCGWCVQTVAETVRSRGGRCAYFTQAQLTPPLAG